MLLVAFADQDVGLSNRIECLPRRPALVLAVELHEEVCAEVLFSHVAEVSRASLDDVSHAVKDLQDRFVFFDRRVGSGT
jgi:hypothetical protein